MSFQRLLCFYFLNLIFSLTIWGKAEFSTAGFYEVPSTGRQVYSMNLAWRFHRGDVQGHPESVHFNDSAWSVISVPHGLEYLPVESSGCANYQGVAWYRKHFIPSTELKGKQLFLHFEGIMGKCQVFVNGQLLKEHFGGYLPVIVDITKNLKVGEKNLIAVKADNSNDPSYPVGKPQTQLDFTYFGGIYRDCWLVAHNDVFITHPNYENEVAGGGLFVSFADVSETSALVRLKTHIRNSSRSSQKLSVEYVLKDKEGNAVKTARARLSLKKGKAAHTESVLKLQHPHLWSPESPYLYDLYVSVKNSQGQVVDGYRQRIGVRSIEFRQTDGLWLNGKPYPGKIMGTNRHQDFAVLGHALPNSLQWRDAKKLRDAGLKVIRTHYVIDPAFMDACDELGLFALVEVPGWQFWNKQPIFAERLYQDIRDMVRIHRNHASLFFWEPILNETRYPEDFAKNARAICDEEYPYPYSVAACDHGARGDQYFDLLLRPKENELRTDKTYFIREWGDNVDDWNSQNSDSRVARSWGEVPMLLQAAHYACPDYLEEYPILCYESICQKPNQIVGACFWHSFDHQRGYHADPFYGGIMDAFRQPKTSYYMFQSQRSPEKSDLIAETGPMVYIAHEMTPFSPADVTVYSNCDEVRLTVFEGGKVYTYHKDKHHLGMPSPIITFKDAFHFMALKKMARSGQRRKAYLYAEGLIDGKVVATHRRYSAGQADRIRLRVDDEQLKLKADGSDVVAVVAEVVDKFGVVKRLNNSIVRFTVEGEGRLLGDGVSGVNPQPIAWGSAVALLQSTPKSGKIKVTAMLEVPGEARPLEGVLEFESQPSLQREIYDAQEQELTNQPAEYTDWKKHRKSDLERENVRLRKEINQLKVRKVEKQQTEFGVGIND